MSHATEQYQATILSAVPGDHSKNKVKYDNQVGELRCTMACASSEIWLPNITSVFTCVKQDEASISKDLLHSLRYVPFSATMRTRITVRNTPLHARYDRSQ